MKKSVALSLFAFAMAIGVTAIAAKGQIAKPGSSTGNEMVRWHGQVVRVNTDASTVDVRRGHITRAVHFDSNTKWTKTDPKTKKVVEISPSDVKAADSVICLGKFNDKKEFWAERIDLRAGKTAY
jgi:hypothetical protein